MKQNVLQKSIPKRTRWSIRILCLLILATSAWQKPLDLMAQRRWPLEGGIFLHYEIVGRFFPLSFSPTLTFFLHSFALFSPLADFLFPLLPPFVSRFSQAQSLSTSSKSQPKMNDTLKSFEMLMNWINSQNAEWGALSSLFPKFLVLWTSFWSPRLSDFDISHLALRYSSGFWIWGVRNLLPSAILSLWSPCLVLLWSSVS